MPWNKVEDRTRSNQGSTAKAAQIHNLKMGGKRKKSFETPKIVLKVLRRLHLAELASMYEAERSIPRKIGQPSAREEFLEIYFPHTIKVKSEKANERKEGEKGDKRKKGEKGDKRKKGKKVSKREGH